jgi:hypothetical protein
MIPCREGYCPVRIQARFGEQRGTAWNAFVKYAPCWARASMWGVSR